MSTQEILCTPIGEMLDQLSCHGIATGQEDQVIYGEVDDLARIK